jgi:protoporphyrinogen/coproporphyrinogen III oxidase
MKRIVIIGGGISGLSAAHRILECNQELRAAVHLTLLEAGPRIGGMVQTDERDGFLLERGPDSFLSEKPAALELARRLGLESRLIETNKKHRRSFIVRRGRLLPVPDGFHLLAPAQLWSFLGSGIFSWHGKARMAMDLLIPRRNVNGNPDESLAQFVRRRLGREALERMAQPMIGGIYTADPEKLSLQATMPRFLEMEREHGSLIRALRREGRSPKVREGAKSETSGARYSLFLSFDRGMQLLTDKLGQTISNFKSQIAEDGSSPQVSIRVNTAVESLTLDNQVTCDDPPKWNVRTNDDEILVADAVCLAVPAYVSARLLRNVDAQIAAELDGIPYVSSATINLAYKRDDIPHPLDGFGFVVPFIEKRSLIACTFSNVKFAGRAPEAHVLLRAFAGGALQPEVLGLSEGELISHVRADLRDLLGIERAPMFAEVSQWERSMPQYHVGHVEKVERIRDRVAALPGLVLAGNAYSGPGIPDCIRSGEAAAGELLSARDSKKAG